ncbi:MAG: RluA family pseudouridine synthase [Bacteroidales bacterium]|nr:RluA family pseudouridine synthase [Bacteroidales bacterium]MBN2756280.1 RluA family pseudouridine synthase [Bacteroidales bacterium]
MKVIYEDNHIIIVNKECSEIVQGDKTGDITLLDIVKSYIKEKYNKPGEVFLGLVHRLDRPTSGIVVFARTSKALTRLNQMFKDKEVKKIYYAVVDKLPPKNEDTLTHFLLKNEKQNKSYASDNEKNGSKKSSLTYKLISNSDKYYLLEIELHTGRHHQIRAQLATINCRIKGDLKYGFPRSNKDGGIHLHAGKIEFIHPVSKKLIKLEANPPDDVLWNEFFKNRN